MNTDNLSDFEIELEKYSDLFKNYVVYPTGVVKDLRTGELVKTEGVKGALNDIRLHYDNGDSVIFALPQLVATLYLDNPTNRKSVRHMNRKLKDNDIDNLMWIGHSGMSQKLVIKEDKTGG